MKNVILFLFLGLCALANVRPAAGAPLEAYGQLPMLENLAISPNGKLLAYVTHYEGESAVVVYDLDAGSVASGVNLKKLKIRDVRWADNDNILVTASQSTQMDFVLSAASEKFVTQTFNLPSKTLYPLLEGKQDSLNIDVGIPEARIVNGHTIIFAHGITFVEGSGVISLFAVDLNMDPNSVGRIKVLERGNRNTEGWVVGEDGTVVAAIEYHEADRDWVLERRQGGQWVKAYETRSSIDTPSIDGFDSSGHALVVQSVDGGTLATRLIGLDDGSDRLLPDDETTRGSVVLDQTNDRILGRKKTDARFGYVFFNKADQSAWNSVSAAFAGDVVELIAWSSDRKRIVVRVDGPQVGSEYQLVDLNTGLAKPIGPAFKDVGAADVSEVRFISYAAADGTKIPAYLTLPSGRPHDHMPLVVLAHGGPTAQDNPGFDWWAQALASRGYAVLQPEFRGSEGFGWGHLSAGFGQWGRKMQTDLSDGVRYLASQGLIDSKKVCIVGASYGGYAALAGPTLDRGVYRCAVSVSGISDPHAMMRWLRSRQIAADSISLRFMTRFMGVESYDDPRLSEISPMSHAADADAPILLIHGTSDTIVPIGQSIDMESALRSAGKPVEFVRLDSEDHWLSRSETREQMLSATAAFLAKYNPAD